jgi:hypothetical protein
MVRPGRRSAVALGGLALVLAGAKKETLTSNQKAFYADASLVAFVRPDPKGVPLERTGVSTPGAVSLNFVTAYIPEGQQQYVDFAGDGYQHMFSTRTPAGFDPTTTHTIGIYGSRHLTEFDRGTNYASATFHFVANGSPVTLVRDVIRTESCNQCRDQLSAHGGSRRGIESACFVTLRRRRIPIPATPSLPGWVRSYRVSRKESLTRSSDFRGASRTGPRFSVEASPEILKTLGIAERISKVQKQ